MRMPLQKSIPAMTALVVWFCLGLQLVLTVDRMTDEGATIIEAIWRFFGFFTILTNIAVAVVSTAMLLPKPTIFNSARARLYTAASIALVGFVYSVALRAIWSPTGWQLVADRGLHDVSPIMFLLAWFIADHGRLVWRDALWAVAAPMAYLLYAVLRGAFDGWYAYWFLDLNQLSGFEFIRNMVVIAIVFCLFALALVALDKWLARRQTAATV